VISEKLTFPFDEGIKNFAYHLIKELSNDNKVLAFSLQSRQTDEKYIRKVNNSFLNSNLLCKIKRFIPNVIMYIPYSSATFFSLLRGRVLQLLFGKSKVVLFNLQPRKYSFPFNFLVRVVKPHLLFVLSGKTYNTYKSFGFNVKSIPVGVDVDKFAYSSETKKELRDKYNLPLNKFTILHVGPIRMRRNIGDLISIQKKRDIQVVLAGSTSTIKERYFEKNIVNSGIKIIDYYIESIEEIYQLADCYIFPVESETGCIEIPLSVLEAMACNLPIITKRYGGLPELFNEGNGFFYYKNRTEIEEKINLLKSVTIKTRKMVESYSWKNVTNRIMNEIFR